MAGDHVPILVADDALPNTDALTRAARAADYAVNGPYYPGVRAPAPTGYAQMLASSLLGPLRRLFGWGEADRAEVMTSDFSLVTTRPDALIPMQRMPHYDGTDTGVVAVLHYLCGPEHGGTSFFRHKETGFELITEERLPAYERALERGVAEHGLPVARYTEDGGPLFERTATHDCRFNRLLVYPGACLHSGRIPENHPLSEDPMKGRLTANTFLRRVPA